MKSILEKLSIKPIIDNKLTEFMTHDRNLDLLSHFCTVQGTSPNDMTATLRASGIEVNEREVTNAYALSKDIVVKDQEQMAMRRGAYCQLEMEELANFFYRIAMLTMDGELAARSSVAGS